MNRQFLRIRKSICLLWVFLLVTGPIAPSAAAISKCQSPCCSSSADSHAPINPVFRTPQTGGCCGGTQYTTCKIKKVPIHHGDACLTAGRGRKEDLKTSLLRVSNGLLSYVHRAFNNSSLNNESQTSDSSISIRLKTSVFLI
ncbi:MAG: hypothetical protein H8D61_01105 [Deltaproteobacteria bacterium]|nr:hypothetical protein [Deltaproteobacteria bacterium]